MSFRVTLKPDTYVVGDPRQLLDRSTWEEIKEEDNSDIIEYDGHELCWLAVKPGTFYGDEETELDLISGSVIIMPEELAVNSIAPLTIVADDGLRVIFKNDVLEVGNESFDFGDSYFDDEDADDESYDF
jgi:hypothetical protein